MTQSRMTKKYKSAITFYNNLLSTTKWDTRKHTSAQLYALLDSSGYEWASSHGKWYSKVKKTTIRISGENDIVHAHVSAIAGSDKLHIHSMREYQDTPTTKRVYLTVSNA